MCDMNNLICVSTEDFTKYIMDYMYSEEFENMFNNTLFSQLDEWESSQCLRAMRHGLNWAALLMNSSHVDKIVVIREAAKE